ncbi:MAG: hemerythrin domain-containing protein [Anaerolineales bacterium]|nr:hemerythrin domain-containing protein [Candidatus Atribacteria bacterium]MDP2993833.1 hemerythrin domain-containing protein [Anaerolineales bacterium]
MSKAIADLMNEHEAILSAIQILERMIATIEKATSVETKDIHDFIGFLKEFADKCHHGKEEGLLFPAMIGAGVPDKGGPIGVMLAEHAQGRKLIRDMEESISTDVDRMKLAQAAREYANLLRNHIQKENNVLFPMAERVLTETQLEKLYKGFEEHEEKVIGQGRHEELHAMLKSLQEKYPM